MSNTFFLTNRAKESFIFRHIGVDIEQIEKILNKLQIKSLNQLIEKTIPANILSKRKMDLPESMSENDLLKEIKKIAKKNDIHRYLIGLGYYDTITPPVIQRNILENPGWYTQYTPYQAEIAQGRLEALLNFQTLIVDLTGLPVSNASLLDEATAAAEAMALCLNANKDNQSKKFFISKDVHPQTISVVKTRAKALGVSVEILAEEKIDFKNQYFGMLLQYPNTTGTIKDYSSLIHAAQKNRCMTVLATDLLALTLLKSPGALGADVAIGSAQRFGVPMGFGGPHAAFISTKDELKRLIPGRIVGLSKDKEGRNAIRLALQTREQHIRREKATSNICTSQVLLAVMASMYAVYHGPKGLRKIAERIHTLSVLFVEAMHENKVNVTQESFFDTVTVDASEAQIKEILKKCNTYKLEIRKISSTQVSISFDERSDVEEVNLLISIFSNSTKKIKEIDVSNFNETKIINELKRKIDYLKHPVFNSYHSETEMLRYIRKLESKDLSLTSSMIPLGSCTMKLNATFEMLPVTWNEFSSLHPFAPKAQTQGYLELFETLEKYLCEITGFDAVSLQPNAGSQGEYAGLLAIKSYHSSRNEEHRDVCLIPRSAHGTNPASAAMAGFRVVVVECDAMGNVDLVDLEKKANEYKKNLAALMVTYPSTHGVFETGIKKICETVHQAGGQVYMDGANMNAQVGLCFPGEFGPDVCHLNLHKTFCIPHGGGGPGMGPICVKKHLTKFLPSHPLVDLGHNESMGTISAAPWGSASILPISWLYIRGMGAEGLSLATQVAILNANYIASKLDPYYPVLYKGEQGLVAHECIIDLRQIKSKTGIDVEDVAKRLMDYGFHAPTVSFPVSGTLMIEPTESESLSELDRFCEAMISIRNEIKEIEEGTADIKNNILKNAPHTANALAKTEWSFPYSREKAVYPIEWVREKKFWPSVSRIDGVAGDRNLICTCPDIDSYS